MGLIDFILNIAGLLLWLNWRAVRLDPLTRAHPAAPTGALKRAGPSGLRRWHFLAVLAGLVFVRALFYWQIGPAVNWTPKLDLVFVAPAFRIRGFAPALLFSLLSFARALIVFHFWLLFLALVNRHERETGPFGKIIQLQLGPIARWPKAVQLALPLIVASLAWIALNPLLVRIEVVSRAQSAVHLVEQSLLVGAGLYFSLKYVLPAFLFAHLVASYVYLGNSPLWDFVNATARNILAPLNRAPLRFGKIDFAPLAGIVLIVLLLQTLPNIILSELSRRNLPVWPP